KKRNKPSTQEGSQGVIDRNIIPLLGCKKVQDVKRRDIAGLMEKLAYKPTEANKTFGVIRKMFTRALRLRKSRRSSTACSCRPVTTPASISVPSGRVRRVWLDSWSAMS